MSVENHKMMTARAQARPWSLQASVRACVRGRIPRRACGLRWRARGAAACGCGYSNMHSGPAAAPRRDGWTARSPNLPTTSPGRRSSTTQSSAAILLARSSANHSVRSREMDAVTICYKAHTRVRVCARHVKCGLGSRGRHDKVSVEGKG